MGGALNEMIDRLEGQVVAHASFTADISHELGNPINTTLLQAQMACDPDVSRVALHAAILRRDRRTDAPVARKPAATRSRRRDRSLRICTH